LSPAVHGSIDRRELQRLGLRPEDVLDFSANINPYAPTAAVQEAIANVPLGEYPDRECRALRAALAETTGMSPEQILPGNGASELIWLAGLAFVCPGSRVLILGPTYGEYARAAGLMGACTNLWTACETAGFDFDAGEISARLDSLRPQLVFLCNPNNPTGRALSAEAIMMWSRRHARTWFVVDEAYLPFATGIDSVPVAAENIVVLRSMTKDFGLAGLRLGYALGSNRVIALLRGAQPPWSVNAMAQAAGVAVLREPVHRRAGLARLAQAKEDLVADLLRLGLTPQPSSTHYFLLQVGDGAAFRLALLRRGVLVRDCASFGLPAHVRIAARRPEENHQLLAAVQEVMR
jgi:threonine-phosphate decarboxylase